MALTRKFLRALGIEDEKIDQIIEAHTETTEALKKERDQAVRMTEQSEAVAKERDELKTQLEALRATGADAAKVQAEFDSYKAAIETERTNAQKADAVKALLKSAGVQRDQFLDLLMGRVDMGKVEIENGAVKGGDEFVNGLKTQYSDLFGTISNKPTQTITPPAASKEQLDAMDDAAYYAATYKGKR